VETASDKTDKGTECLPGQVRTAAQNSDGKGVEAAAGVAVRPPPPSPAPASPDLAALSRAIARGDEAALAALYELWFDRALSLAGAATRRTPLSSEAARLDIVQDAFVRVIRSIRPMATAQDVERWLARIIKTTALDRMRRESRRLARERRRPTDHAPPPPTDPDDAADLAERIAWLRARLEDLTEEERSLLGLRFGHGSTLDEAGAATGITGHAAHGRLRRAIDKLRLSARNLFHERS